MRVTDEMVEAALLAWYGHEHHAMVNDNAVPDMRAAIEAALAAAPQAEQEPVAWRTFDGEGGYDYRTYEGNENYAAEWAQRNPHHVGWVEPLYTTPPQRKPLTDEEIVDAVREADLDWHSGWTLDEHEPNRFTTLVRAVEQAHGIKERR